MYLAVNTEVIFPESRGRKAFKFSTLSSFRTESSWQVLTDTAEFVIAKALYFDDKDRVFNLIKPGDPVQIRGGYNGEYFDEFKGFISEIQDDMPVVFKCEDNMYVLKRTVVNKSYSSVKLATLLADIVPSQFKIDAMDVEIGARLLKQQTVAQVLQDLKDDMGIYSYFVDDTLVSGKIYLDNPFNQVVKYDTTKNVLPGNDLKYRRKDDIRLKVTMTSYLSTGKKKKVTVGDDDGQEQKLVCTNVSDENEIKKLAQKELDRLKIDGYSGGFTGFGIPFVRHGYTVSLVNSDNPDKNGNYYIDKVVSSLENTGAYRRRIELGPSAAK